MTKSAKAIGWNQIKAAPKRRQVFCKDIDIPARSIGDNWTLHPQPPPKRLLTKVWIQVIIHKYLMQTVKLGLSHGDLGRQSKYFLVEFGGSKHEASTGEFNMV